MNDELVDVRTLPLGMVGMHWCRRRLGLRGRRFAVGVVRSSEGSKVLGGFADQVLDAHR
jgi:hypothetical protein